MLLIFILINIPIIISSKIKIFLLDNINDIYKPINAGIFIIKNRILELNF